MDLLARIAQRRRGRELAWPVGKGALTGLEESLGHDDSRFSPEEYGDYIATSQDVYAVVTKRSRLMSGLELRSYHGRGADKLEVTSGPVVDLLRYVNPFWTFKRLQRVDEQAMGLWGETYWAVQKDALGQPKEIWWMKPPRVTPVPHESGYLAGYLYHPINGGPPIPFAPDEVVWFRYPNPIDEFSALSPLAAARLAADTGAAMMLSNKKLFDQGMQMGGFVVPKDGKVTFGKTQAEDLERQLQSRFKGVDKAHRWAVLRFEAEFKNAGISPKDAEFVNGLNLSLRRVCNAYGMQSALLNDLEHATLSNAGVFERLEWSAALKPDAELRAAEIEEQLLPMFRPAPGHPLVDHVEFDFSTVPALQESASESWARERQAIEVGALTINEWRASKGLPPVAWGDVYWAPVNKSAVTDETSTPQGDTAPTALPSADPDPDEDQDVIDAEVVAETAWRRLMAALDTPGRLP